MTPPVALDALAEAIRATRRADDPAVDLERLRQWLAHAGACPLGPEDVERLRALAREPDPC
jgi:hypothetical protein